MITGKNILIAGGAGFIGSNLIDLLMLNNNRIIVIDNFSTSASSNIQKHMQKNTFQFIEGDICNFNFGFKENFDYIFNLACPASPPKYMAQSILTLNTCFNGTKNLLDLSLKHSAVFVQASTSEVYGDPTISPQSEDYYGNVNSYGPRACYDEGKRVAEALVYEYVKCYDANCRVARIFNTYGPMMDPYDGRVISNFINQTIQKEVITIYGDGSQTRSFCYISDLIRGLILLAESDVMTPMNLGNNCEFSILELADKVDACFNNTSKRVYSKLPINDPMQRKPDITLARTKLGWEPKVSLDEGIEKTKLYFERITGKFVQ